MRARLLALVLATALGAAAVPGVAAADDAADAAKQFATAQDLYDHGRHDEALPMFREALRATGSPNARLYVARSLRELGRLAEAYEEMSETLRDARARADTEPKYVPTRDAAASELALLERRVGRVIVAIANPPSGVTVSLNGNDLPVGRVGAPVAVMPGMISVSVEAPGREPVAREVTVSAGETKTVALALGGQKATGAPAPAPAAPDEAPRSGGGVRTAGFVVAGLGVAGMGLFAVTGLMANSKFKTLEEECGGVRCTDPKYADTIDSGKTLDLLATIGLIAGATGIAAGGAMILFGGPSSADDESARVHKGPAVGVSITPQGASVRGAFVF